MPKQLELDTYMNWDKYTQELVDAGFKGECSVWRKHMRTSSNLFNASCVVHDVSYQRGGTEKDRRDADRGLYRRSVLNAASLQNVCFMWYYIVVATTWYLAVRLFGWAAFRYDGPHDRQKILAHNKWKNVKRRNSALKQGKRAVRYAYLKISRKMSWQTLLTMLN